MAFAGMRRQEDAPEESGKQNQLMGLKTISELEGFFGREKVASDILALKRFLPNMKSDEINEIYCRLCSFHEDWALPYKEYGYDIFSKIYVICELKSRFFAPKFSTDEEDAFKFFSAR